MPAKYFLLYIKTQIFIFMLDLTIGFVYVCMIFYG